MKGQTNSGNIVGHKKKQYNLLSLSDSQGFRQPLGDLGTCPQRVGVTTVSEIITDNAFKEYLSYTRMMFLYFEYREMKNCALYV